MVHLHSLECYEALLKDDRLTKREKQVYTFVKEHPRHTGIEYAKLMGLDKDQVRPRLTALKQKGLIKEHGIRAVNGRPHARFVVTGNTEPVIKDKPKYRQTAAELLADYKHAVTRKASYREIYKDRVWAYKHIVDELEAKIIDRMQD